jgi:hypothetical protein
MSPAEAARAGSTTPPSIDGREVAGAHTKFSAATKRPRMIYRLEMLFIEACFFQSAELCVELVDEEWTSR